MAFGNNGHVLSKTTGGWTDGLTAALRSTESRRKFNWKDYERVFFSCADRTGQDEAAVESVNHIIRACLVGVHPLLTAARIVPTTKCIGCFRGFIATVN